MRENQCNRNNKSVRKRRPRLSIPRGISISRCFSTTVYLEKSSSCFTRIYVTLCSRETRLSPGNWKRHGRFSKRAKKREAFARILSSHSTSTLSMFKLWEEKTSWPLLIVELAWNLMPDVNERAPLWIKTKC